MTSMGWLWHNLTLNWNDKYDYDIITILNQNGKYGMIMGWQYEMGLGKGSIPHWIGD